MSYRKEEGTVKEWGSAPPQTGEGVGRGKEYLNKAPGVASI